MRSSASLAGSASSIYKKLVLAAAYRAPVRHTDEAEPVKI
jgi:hypothetical protein